MPGRAAMNSHPSEWTVWPIAWGAAGVVGRFGGWYGGLVAMPSLSAAAGDPNLAEAVRNNALATAAALLIGLVGAVLGGWVASGEPMTLTYHRTREARERLPGT